MPAQTHTPGPWKWIHYPDGRELLAAPSCAVIHCPDAPMAVSLEDCALIASAPDLLAAAALALRDLREFMPTVSAEAITALEAAIAKAEGR